MGEIIQENPSNDQVAAGDLLAELTHQAQKHTEPGLSRLSGIQNAKAIEKLLKEHGKGEINLTDELAKIISDSGVKLDTFKASPGQGLQQQVTGLSYTTDLQRLHEAMKQKTVAVNQTKETVKKCPYTMRKVHKGHLQNDFFEMHVGTPWKTVNEGIAQLQNYEDTMHKDHNCPQRVESRAIDLSRQTTKFLFQTDRKQTLSKRYTQFQNERNVLAEHALTRMTPLRDEVHLHVSSAENNPHHRDHFTSQEITDTSLISKADRKKHYKGVAPFIVQRELEFELSEAQHDAQPKLAEFDPITRRYLEFCQMTG